MANCEVCGGSRAEHFDDQGKQITQHMFTDVPGNLTTPQDDAKARLLAGQRQGQVIQLPGAQTNEAGAIGRLVGLLVEKHELTPEEALYVAGYGPKPTAKFADPARLLDVEVRR